MQKEYGGYFEIELPKGEEYFKGDNCFRVNTGRAAIYAALKASGAKKVYMPHYLCTSMLQAPNALGIPYELYYMDEHFMPIGIDQTTNEEAIIIVNYFGIGNRELYKSLLKSHPNLIIDNTQAFFSEPIKGAYNLYSPRKFFGVPDGGYLIKDGFVQYNLAEDRSYFRSLHLLKRIEEGANAAYADNLKNEAYFDDFELRAMSPLTKRILEGIDYNSVKSVRNNNFKILDERLSKFNLLKIDSYDGAMVYPLFVKAPGLREYLVKNKVYVQHWWKDVLLRVVENSLEAELSNYLIPLPMDQRYDASDMMTIAELVEAYMGGRA